MCFFTQCVNFCLRQPIHIHTQVMYMYNIYNICNNSAGCPCILYFSYCYPSNDIWSPASRWFWCWCRVHDSMRNQIMVCIIYHNTLEIHPAPPLSSLYPLGYTLNICVFKANILQEKNKKNSSKSLTHKHSYVNCIMVQYYLLLCYTVITFLQFFSFNDMHLLNICSFISH